MSKNNQNQLLSSDPHNHYDSIGASGDHVDFNLEEKDKLASTIVKQSATEIGNQDPDAVDPCNNFLKTIPQVCTNDVIVCYEIERILEQHK